MSSKYVVLLCTPQRLKARVFTLIGILIRLAKEVGRGPWFFLWWTLAKMCCTGSLNRNCWAASHCQFQLLVCSTCSHLIIITQIVHCMQGQYSNLMPMPFFCCSSIVKLLWCNLCIIWPLVELKMGDVGEMGEPGLVLLLLSLFGPNFALSDPLCN